jgi:hypothetical protein
MADFAIGGSPSPVITPNQFPPAAAGLIAKRLLRRHSPHEIAEAVEVLIDVLDLLGGDPDAEDCTDAEDDFALSPNAEGFGANCASGDPLDQDAGAYAEWHTLSVAQRKAGACLVDACGHEDDEEDDEDCCSAGDDDPARRVIDGLPGDSYDTELNGDEGDYSDGE